jgi:hypothetical protein
MGGLFIQKKLSFIEKDVQRWPFRLSTNMLGRYKKEDNNKEFAFCIVSVFIFLEFIHSRVCKELLDNNFIFLCI